MGTTSAGSIQLDLDVKSDLDSDIQGEASKLASRIKKQVDAMSNDMFKNLRESMASSLDKMTETVRSCLEGTKKEMWSFVQEMAAMVKSMGSIQMPRSESGSTVRPINIPANVSIPRAPPSTSQIKEPETNGMQMENIRAEIEATTMKLQSLNQKMAEYKGILEHLSESRSSIATIRNEIQSNEAQITSLNQKIQMLKKSQLETTSMKQKIGYGEQIKTLKAQIESTSSDITYLKTKLAEISKINVGAGISSINQKIAALGVTTVHTEARLARLKASLDTLRSVGAATVMPAFPQIANPLSSIDTGPIKVFGMSIDALKGKLLSLSLPMVKTGIRQLGNAFMSAGKHVLSLGSKLLGLNSIFRKTSLGMNSSRMSLGRLVKSFVVFSLVFPLVSRGIMALGRSIGTTLMANESFARSLDQIKSNLMASFMPIYNAILPALNSFMSALANVTAHFAAFISTIFGTTYSASINAAKGMVEAKDAMGAYGSAAKKAAKDANQSVMAFDKLNKLNGKNDDAGGGSAPNIIPTDIDTSSASSLAEKIKKMFEEQDYEGIGQLIGEGINRGVAKITQFIDWSNVGGKITGIVDGITRIFNSAIATIDWNAAGGMFGTGINTVANTIKMFFEGINWEGLGQSLGNGLSGLVHKVDWTNLGQTFGSYFQARINGLYGFITTADWPGLGKGLADGVMGLANYIDAGRVGQLIGGTLQAAISSVHNFVTNIDWRSLGGKIASSINNFFSSINWAEFGLTFSQAVRGLFGMLRQALADIDWLQIGIDLATFLSNVDWLGLLLDIGVIIGRAFIGLGSVVLRGVHELGANIVQGFYQGIMDLFTDPFAWVREHIVDPFINAIKDLFGIHSPSTVLAEIGVNLIQGLINGIGSIIGTLIGNVAGWFGGIAETISGTWTSIKVNASSAWEGICSGVGGFVGNIKTSVSEGFAGAKQFAVEHAISLKTGVITTFENMKNGIGQLPGQLKNIASDMFNRMRDGVNSTIGNVKSAITTGIDSAVNYITSLPQKAISWGADMMSGMANGIKGAAGWVSDAVSGVAGKISSWLHFSRPDVGPLREYETWMPDMMQGLSKTMTASAPLLLGNIKSLASRISTTMQDIQPQVAFTGHTTINDQYNKADADPSTEILYVLKEIVGLLKSANTGSSGGTTSQEIVLKIGDTEFARIVIAAIKKYEKETGRQVLIS